MYGGLLHTKCHIILIYINTCTIDYRFILNSKRTRNQILRLRCGSSENAKNLVVLKKYRYLHFFMQLEHERVHFKIMNMRINEFLFFIH
jgi:hypothetical protein